MVSFELSMIKRGTSCIHFLMLRCLSAIPGWSLSGTGCAKRGCKTNGIVTEKSEFNRERTSIFLRTLKK